MRTHEQQAAADVHWALREAPFWLCLVLWSCVPLRAIPWWRIAGTSVKSLDVSVIALAAYYLCMLPVFRKGSDGRPGLALMAATTFMMVYAGLSAVWAGLTPGETVGMIYSAVAALSAVFVGYVLTTTGNAEDLQKLLWRLCLGLTFVSGVYFAESFFALGMRDPSWKGNPEFGIVRVSGPLYEPTTGFILLTPALAWTAQCMINRQKSRLLALAMLLTLAIATIGMGSRSGLVVLGIFVLTATFAIPQMSKRIAVLAATVLIATGAWAVLATKVKTTRLKTMEHTRMENHETAWQILTHRSLWEQLSGAGYGSTWPWYPTEAAVEGGNLYNRHYPRRTQYGNLLIHAHSTFLVALVELGIPGLLFTVCLWVVLIRAVRAARKRPWLAVAAAGLFASAFSLGFDLFLFRRPTRDALWWVFVFGILRLLFVSVKDELDRVKFSAAEVPQNWAATEHAPHFAARPATSYTFAQVSGVETQHTSVPI